MRDLRFIVSLEAQDKQQVADLDAIRKQISKKTGRGT